MKKKLTSLIAIMFIVFASVFASACGDKYKDMTFRVYYAFSENATEWYDGTDGISLNYNTDIARGADSNSLVFDEFGVATLFVRIEVENVKTKHIDSISVTSATVNGLSFSSSRVEHGQVFTISISSNINTTIRLYENNSGCQAELPFVVSRELTEIVADASIKPAMPTNGSLNLLRLNNLQYLPLHQTNQIGVNYSVHSVGYYDAGNLFVDKIGAEEAKEYITIQDGVLAIKDSRFFSDTQHIIKVKATSIYHDGTKDGTEEKSAYFDVYVVENSIADPIVRFDDAENEKINSQINIYENGGKYATSTVEVDADALNSIYKGVGLKTYEGNEDGIEKYGVAKFKTVVYVRNALGVFVKYDFEDAKFNEGVNGLIVTDNGGGKFTFSIGDRNVTRNTVRFAYEVEGLDFSASQDINAKKDLVVVKGVVPTCITVNDSIDLTSDSDPQDAVITANAVSGSLELKLAANPNDSDSRVINLSNAEGGLLITNNESAVSGDILSGSIVSIKFKDGVMAQQTLEIKTLKAPTYYNEKNITSDIINNNDNYIVVKYNITKMVTADEFAFVETVTDIDSAEEIYVNANNDSEILVKAYYTGVSLDAQTIKLRSDNNKIVFGNNSTEMSLKDATFMSGDSDANGKYDLYAVSIKASKSMVSANISIVAGDGSLGVEKSVQVSSVYLMDNPSKIDVNAKSSNVKEFDSTEVSNGAFNFAISKGEFGEFVVVDEHNSSRTISKIEIKTVNVGKDGFSTSAINYNVVSNSTFAVNGRVGGKTQVVDLKIYYFAEELGIVREKNTIQSVQIAVYDGIGMINVSKTKNTIGYVNLYYTEASSSEVNFDSYTSNYATPASSVVFNNGTEVVSVDKASQIQVDISNYLAIKNSDLVSINFVSGVTSINLIENNGKILTVDDVVFLQGTINVQLNGEVGNLNEISFALKALNFGLSSNTITNVTIKVATVDEATAIMVSGDDFVETSDESSELQFSFMSVADGGYDEKTFNASLQFAEDATNENKLRFDNIETALTHILYRYELDANGNLRYDADGSIIKTRIQDDFFGITYSNGQVNVKAYKNLGGGLFRLVLATKDSYNLNVNPTTLILEEEFFDQTFDITVRVSDGTKQAAYIIKTVEDLVAIKYNLDKNFILQSHLDLGETTYDPIGLIGGAANPFTGSLNGQFTTLVGKGETKVSVYSISFTVEKLAFSSIYGNLAGLFAVIGEDGLVENLNMNVKFASKFASAASEGLKVGAVAGVNNGTISNVQVEITNNGAGTDLSDVTAGDIDFGGIVGLNNNEIVDSRAEMNNEIIIVSDVSSTHNIGSIVGTNSANGSVVGAYIGKESLNNFVYDVIANITVQNKAIDGTATYYIGGAVGSNHGLVEGLLVGGKITTLTEYHGVEVGAVGGVVANSAGTTNSIKLCTALAMDLIVDSTNLDVGGVVGYANNTTIDTVKFVSIQVEGNGLDANGMIQGKNFVGGIVAKSTAGTIKYASVESFVDVIEDKTNGTTTKFYHIKGGISGTTAGLVASISGTIVDNSFVNANIESVGKIILTVDSDVPTSYYIGTVSRNLQATDVNKTSYSIVETSGMFTIMLGNTTKSIDWNSIMVPNSSVNASTTDWTNIYTTNAVGNFVKAESYEAGKNYYTFDSVKRNEFTSSWNQPNILEVREYYNVISIRGVDFFFPYIVRSYDHDNDAATPDKTEPLLIVAPQSISASINTDYFVDHSVVHVKEFNIEEYVNKITESVVVNFYDRATEEDNAHNIITYTDKDGNIIEGLLDVTILPEDAQGGYAYEIIGDGYKFAYINSKKQIVFTQASGQTPILVKIYSVFNTDIETYVVFYSQSLLSKLTLSSSSIYYSNEPGYDYEINTYTGQNNKIIAFDADNVKEGNNNSSIFDNRTTSQYLKVEINSIKCVGATEEILDSTTGFENSLLEINTSRYDNVTVRIEEGADVETNYYEIITFELMLDKSYFGAFATADIPVASVKLLVRLYNAATGIDVNGADSEITTYDDYSFSVNLVTDYVNEDIYLNDNTIEKVEINDNGEFYIDVENSDGIRIAFEIVEGQDVVDELLETNDVDCFARLFKIDILTSLYKTENELKVIGYIYNVMLELKDDHDYRYITDSIKFNIIVTSTSNPDISNKNDGGISILLKPTVLSTARIENYVVTSLNVNTDYTNIVTNNNIETSIVEPGSLGNVMLIYLEPTYSKVVSASIKTSELYVPSLGKNVKMKFTQLVHDQRKGVSGIFTTLYDGDSATQTDDTLDLKLISSIDANGKKIYNGVICIYIQLEAFSGLEATISAELNVETSNGKIFTRTRELLTTYLPGTRIEYNEERRIGTTNKVNEYLIQKGTSQNEARIKIYGYQFNSNPTITFAWSLPTDESGNVDAKIYDDNGDVVGYYEYETRTVIDPAGNPVTIENRQIICAYNNAGVLQDVFLIGDYVSSYMLDEYDEIVYNTADDSYTIALRINVSDEIKAPFILSATLSLTTKDGQLKTSSAEENTIKFYPTDYVLNSVYVSNLANNRKNIAIGKSSRLELLFTTDNAVNDLSSTIFEDLIRWANGDLTKIQNAFAYYKNGQRVTFADEHPEFEFNFINGIKMSISGVEKFNSLIELTLWYGYEDENNDGIYEVRFGQNAGDKLTSSLVFTFTLNIYTVNEENEVLIYSADDVFNSSSGSWDLIEGVNYVLVNDIELENVTPITTAIGGLDGNNKVISIKSFKVDDSSSDYGLFAKIGSYTTEDPETEQTFTKQTILKNVIVDYSKFEGTIALNNNTTSNITFGGLVARNNGGLIYNCDVMNLNVSQDATIDVVVPANISVVLGGLVGVNDGIITNSRVGRDGYTKITATKTTESSVNVKARGLTFSVFNKEAAGDDINQFSIIAGGFVGQNNGTVSTSYIGNTNLFNYSANEVTNITAGFAGENAGEISYSYAKADDETITTKNPYSTGYVIENKGNGIVAGFVYANRGAINNSYANIELKTKSAYISGFVYNNTGEISESYAATTMNAGNIDSNAEQPFVGVDTAGNLLSTGTLENTYYLMRSSTDNPLKQDNLDYARGLNETNFQNSEYLVGFSFVLSNAKVEREQGLWSYYTVDNKKRILPELMNANIISHSYRYVVDEDSENKVLRNATSYADGSANNPYIISNVEEFNKVFTENEHNDKFTGYVRFINNINFNNDETAIKTRANYTLGELATSTKTSVEGNGMTISGIYLDVGEAVIEKIGLFAEIQNAYVKNLNLEFATPTTDGQFSTTTVAYSGGLAGKIENSVIMNINISGANTTLTGKNFVGGLAGVISGTSLIYGIETNVNVKASSTDSYLYYSQKDYEALNIQASSYYNYSAYLNRLSYAGGIAGVLDLTTRSNAEYNVQFIDIRGDLMTAKTFDGKQEANILAEYAGGVAGYASKQTESYRVRYFTGENEIIRGDTAVGGLYGVALGGITASQVTTEEEVQFGYDTNFGKYIIGLENDESSALDKTKVGNLTLLESYKYAGGLVGLGLNSTIKASYSKVGIKSGEDIGGLIGLSVSSVITYSYSIPYVNFYEGMKNVGGLIGSAYGVMPVSPARNSVVANYEALLKHNGINNQGTDIQFTYSTLILDNDIIEDITEINETRTNDNKIVLDYVSANYQDDHNIYLQSNSNTNLIYVYAGTVNYYKKSADDLTVLNQTRNTGKSAIVELYRLYNVGNPDQTIAFQEVFSGWSIIKYWSLNEEKYFPLLTSEGIDNFIDIDDANDFTMLETNPTGNFRVVNDIEIPFKTANWIVRGEFQGILVGELESDSRRPMITVDGLSPTINNTSTGFFESTHNATISNLEFVWTYNSDSKNAIDLEHVDHITYASGLICKDNGSLISNVEVRVSHALGNDNDGYILNNESDATIEGFGGFVGEATDTNILGATFAGKVNANLFSNSDAIYVGGIVAKAETSETPVEGEINNKSMVINNAVIGVKGETSNAAGVSVNYPTTKFDLTVDIDNNTNVYIGGVVGNAKNIAIASASVGGTSYANGYKHVEMLINLNNLSRSISVGGLAGQATEGMILSSDALTNIAVVGNTAEGSSGFIEIGGIVGDYSMTAASSINGISKTNAQSYIKTVTDTAFLSTKLSSHAVMLSTGVASLRGAATLKQAYISGEVNTEGSDITTLYVGGVAANVDSGDTVNVDIEEVTTNSILYAGTENDDDKTGTTGLYVGGLIGNIDRISISYSASWGRVVPITSQNATDVYVGGLIGRITELSISPTMPNTVINNSYTISSIVADSIANNIISELDIGALVGDIQDGATSSQIVFSEVFYSSDYALFADENYLDGDIPLGKNISAQLMLNDNSKEWITGLQTENEVLNNIWSAFTVNGKARLPYLTYLEEILKNYGAIIRDEVTGYDDYASGSAMRPITILSDSTATNYTFQNGYNYYLLTLSTGRVVPTFSGILEGILFGQDLSIDETFVVDTLGTVSTGYAAEIDANYSGVVPAVAKHSAVSNFNVILDKDISVGNVYGVIAGLNNGVIFNSSVQGTGIEFSNSGSAGLIAGKNNGLISYCYSSAEIIEANGDLGGIVHTNAGKLLSNYFTGYIKASRAAGILVVYEGNSYVYNNYMAGVIKGSGANAFSATALGVNGGSNNYMDIYTDYAYHTNPTNDVVKSITTAELMSASRLNGKWYKTVSSNALITDTTIAPTFGVNYNYPVYRFNKLMGGVVNDWKNQLYTGTGLVTSATLNERYEAIVNVGAEEYVNAFKIPHLGVLTAVQSLLNSDRNYVLIYDIDGEYSSDNYIPWVSIGSTGDPINGFVNTNQTEGTKEEGNLPGNGFNGVFVSNKYYSYTLPDADYTDCCVIENLSDQGLFNNIGEAYIGSITLGSFHNVMNSGPLGVKISTDGEVNVNNIVYKEESIVLGSSDDGNEYFGGLFGLVEGSLTVDKFVSSNKDDQPTINLKSVNSTSGLIAGKLDGKIELKKTSSTYFAWFHGNEYAGGLVGDMSGGEIVTNGNEIKLVQTNILGKTAETYTNNLGGIAGKSSGGKIDDVQICLFNSDAAVTDSIKFLANSFGGIVAEISGDVNVGKFTINSSCKEVEFEFNRPEDTYYGLIAANLDVGKLTVATFELASEKVIELLNAEAKNISALDLDENRDDSGVGLFAGKVNSNSGIVVNNYKPIAITISSYNNRGLSTTNVGGFVGYFAGTEFTVGVQDIEGEPGTPIPVIDVEGLINVGGLFGYCAANIDSANFEEKLINTSSKYARVMVYSNSKNIGGLFGRWDGSNGSGPIEESTYTSISSFNEISVAYVENNNNVRTSFNIGGIAGKIAGGNLGKLVNNAQFTYVSSYYSSTEIKISEQENSIRTINVGGIAGYVESDTGTFIKDIVNRGNVIGYQNVGGLIGYAKGAVSIINTNSVKFNEPPAGEPKYEEIGYDGTNLINATIPTIGEYETDSDNRINKGSVYGVINVGGVAGYAGEASIEQIYSTANVYGNTNVGGLVGLSQDAKIKNNYIHSFTSEDVENYEGAGAAAAEADEIETYGVVKAIFFNKEVSKMIGATKVYEQKYYIPTSAGGMVGTSRNTEFSQNILNGVIISSSLESEGSTIDTIKNNMSGVVNGSGNQIDVFTAPESIYEIDNKVLEFNEIQSGFGGFVGTIDSESVEYGESGLSITNNYLVGIEINAQLGINTGAFYGVYKRSNADDPVVFPKIYNETNVNASYNIGGLIGYICSSSSLNGLNNKDLQGSATINLQQEMIGIYVGGLIGKTTMSNISGLELSDSRNVNIKINTNHSYYIGGLIGRAEVTLNARISGNLGVATTETKDNGTPGDPADDYQETTVVNDDVVEGDGVTNFGGLIGMLKSGYNASGFEHSIQGYHNKAFTINTVENSNYYEGESDYAVEDDDELRLFATAKYVNKDKFIIQGSNDTSLYSNNLTDITLEDGTVDKADVNPLNEAAHGWAKEYTAFRQLQRNIPQEENNEATWDAIIVLYDAAQITHVGTIENLGLSGVYLPYEDGKTKVFDDDHICFTVYEQASGQATLYSAMGYGQIRYMYDQKSEFVYETVTDSTADGKDWAVGWFVNQSPLQEFYIDARSSVFAESYQDLRGLTYFHWGRDGEWCGKYRTVGGVETSYQNDSVKYDNPEAPDIPTSGIAKYITYFVKDYLKGDSSMQGDAKYSGYDGAYFVFDIVYENASASNLSYGKEQTLGSTSDVYLPSSGSMFEVAGVYTEATDKAQLNSGGKDVFGIISTVVSWVVTIVVTVVTCGVGGAVTAGAKAAVKGAARKAIIKVFFKAAAKHLTRSVRKLFSKQFFKILIKTGKKLAKRLAVVFIVQAIVSLKHSTAAQNAMYVYIHYAKPSAKTYGYISTNYDRDIYYAGSGDNVKLAQQTDYCYASKNGGSYSFVSSRRPNDFHTNKYIGSKINYVAGSIKYKDDDISELTMNGIVMDDTINSQLSSTYFDNVYTNVKVHDSADADGDTYEMIGVKDDEIWVINNVYEIKNGQYYKNDEACDIQEHRVTLNFKPETIDNGFGGGSVDRTEPNYIGNNGGIYVHGNWNGSEYKYGNWDSSKKEWIFNGDGPGKGFNYPGNNLIYDGLNYLVNGKVVSGDIAKVRSGSPMKYIPIDEDPLTGDTLGYDYFSGAYYTLDGNRDMNIKKYAKFNISRGNNAPFTPSAGSNHIEGITYFNELIFDYVQDENGRYVYNESGVPVYVGDDDVLALVPLDSRYRQDAKYKHYVLDTDELFSDTAGDGDGWFEVYPASFTNPYGDYLTTTLASAKDNKIWKYNKTANDSKSLKHYPEYFIYEGGYAVDESEVELISDDEESKYYPTVYLLAGSEYNDEDILTIEPVDNWEAINNGIEAGNYNIEPDLGESTTITIEQLKSDWQHPLNADGTPNYNSYYYYHISKLQSVSASEIVSEIEMDCLLSEQFYVKNGSLYVAKSNYSLNNDGLLVKLDVDLGVKDGSVFNNMYLSNKNFGFYTRYKYTDDPSDQTANQTFIDPELFGGKYMLIPESGSTINYGRPTMFVESATVVLGCSGSSSQLIKLGGSASEVAGNSIGRITVE